MPGRRPSNFQWIILNDVFFSGLFQGSSGPYKTSLEQKLFRTCQSPFIPFPLKEKHAFKKTDVQNLNSLGAGFLVQLDRLLFAPTPRAPRSTSVQILRASSAWNDWTELPPIQRVVYPVICVEDWFTSFQN